jgi:hypothetical protein
VCGDSIEMARCRRTAGKWEVQAHLRRRLSSYSSSIAVPHAIRNESMPHGRDDTVDLREPVPFEAVEVERVMTKVNEAIPFSATRSRFAIGRLRKGPDDAKLRLSFFCCPYLRYADYSNTLARPRASGV